MCGPASSWTSSSSSERFGWRADLRQPSPHVLSPLSAAISLPWHRSWGVTDVERAAALPGDRSPRTPQLEIMHGVSIDAPPEAVWPWLVQIGQDRAGFYSYDWLERCFGDRLVMLWRGAAREANAAAEIHEALAGLS